MDHSVKPTLKSLQDYLKAQDYETKIQPANEINPVEQLLISLGQESHEHKEMILHLFWSQGYEDEASIPADASTSPQFLQFYVLFPFMAVDHAMKDLRTLIFNLNASFDMANFGLYETQRLVYYRYAHAHMGDKIEGEVVIAIIATIQFLFDTLLNALTDVALGRKTLETIQKEAKQAIQDQTLDFDLLS